MMTPHERSLAELTDLSGKVAIVTGAAQGLGFEVASRLAEAGASVVVNDLDEARANEAAAQIAAAGGRATASAGDVSARPGAEALLEPGAAAPRPRQAMSRRAPAPRRCSSRRSPPTGASTSSSTTPASGR